jgi:hypothetical protein
MDYHYPPLTPEQTAILCQDEPYSDVIDYIIQEHLTFNVQAGVQQYRHYDNARQALQKTITQLQEKQMYYLERSMKVLSDLECANILGRILAHHEEFDGNPKAYAAFFLKVAPFHGHVTNSGRDTTVDPYSADLLALRPPASACTVSPPHPPYLSYAEALKKSTRDYSSAPRPATRREMPRPAFSATSSTTSSSHSSRSFCGSHKTKCCHKCQKMGHIRKECPNKRRQVHFKNYHA